MGGLLGFAVVVAMVAMGLNVLGILPLAFLSGAFLFGTLGFWTLVVVESLLILAFLEFDYRGRRGTGFLATVSLVLTLLFLQQFGDVKVFTNLRDNPLNTLFWVLGYFVLGTLWSLAKWWFFLRNKRERYDQLKKSFLREKGVTNDEIPVSLKKEWTNEMSQSYDRYPPEVSRHKSLILMWMAYWPWSAAWTLLNDPIRRLFNEIFAQLRKVYEAMRDRAFRGTENDFSKKDVRDSDG